MKRKRTDNAVERYRARRYNRLKARFDADDEENNKQGGGGGGGHGNTKIPFGLCQREGIKVQPGWTPKDAWKALEGKGYSASGVYEELKKTGKAGKGKSASPAKAKRPPTQINDSAFPDAMISRTYRKNTMEAAKYISEHCDDGNVTDFLASATGKGAAIPKNLTCRRDSDGSGCAVGTSRYFTGELAGVSVIVPMFSAYKDEKEKAAAIGSFAHEWTHYLDHSASEWKSGESFSSKHKKLSEALSKETSITIGDEVKSLFDDFNDQFKKGKEEYKRKREDAWKTVVDEMFGGEKPEWIDERGHVDYWKLYIGDSRKHDEYRKTLKKKQKQIDADWNRKKRSYGDGVEALQGLYDSLYEGQCRDKDIVKFGHSEEYFRRDRSNRAMEVLADYVALKAINPKLIDVFAKDKPELAAAMDECIVDMTKKLRGE